jgi:hypothetical protein
MVVSRGISGEPAASKKNGPLLVQTGRCQVMRVRYRLRPSGDSSRASEIVFIRSNVSQNMAVIAGLTRNPGLRVHGSRPAPG